MGARIRTNDKTSWDDARKMLRKAESEGLSTAWDRLAEQRPQCRFCELGTSCRNCAMGPCRIAARKDGTARLGVCGADADVVVARNFGRFIAGGAASHSDHGRDLIDTFESVATGNAPGYTMRDEGKLRRVAVELGVSDAVARPLTDVAQDLADMFYSDFGSRKKSVSFLQRAPAARRALWDKLGMTPRGIDREVVEMMHRTHMGCDNDAVSLLTHAARTALADGWGGSMIGTELSDMLFGTPAPRRSNVNLGVLRADAVNVLVHGHNPVVSEMVLAAAREPALLEKAKAAGAATINVVGLCCTGNELLMRQGIPMAGNHLMTELAIVTGAADAIVVDYQCIMPGLVRIASCYHTRFVTTSPKGRFTGATHLEVQPHNAQARCREIVALAIDAFAKRDPARVDIPAAPVEMVTGFSNEAIVEALGGSLDPLLGVLRNGQVRGIVGVVGCNNPKIKQDSSNVALMRELVRRDILVAVTGCVTSAAGKAGLLLPDAADVAGPGLSGVCHALGIPPVLHMGSCVDNSRILHLCALLAEALHVDISDLPVVASAPEWYSEKAAAIGLYAVASGIPAHLGHPPFILGSPLVTSVALDGLNGLVGASFMVEGDALKAADLIEERINERRRRLGLAC